MEGRGFQNVILLADSYKVFHVFLWPEFDLSNNMIITCTLQCSKTDVTGCDRTVFSKCNESLNRTGIGSYMYTAHEYVHGHKFYFMQVNVLVEVHRPSEKKSE